MKIPSKFSLALLAGTILSTPANYVAAATLTPTLDTIKAEAADISGNFALSKLDGDLPEGAAEVEIAGVKYYFTPTGEDAALLKTLAGTVAGNLKEDENGIFEFDGKKYSFDVAAIPASVFEYVEGKAEDYNFTMQEADAEGNLTTKYYKVILKPENFSASESITWGTSVQTGDTTGSVAVNLPNNQTQTFYYAYNKPADYTETGTRINNTLGTANVTGVVFKDISSSSSGGAIYNTQDHGDINITADFIGNYADGYSVWGGAIYNSGTIGDITGDFIGNDGEAIFNRGTIGDITGDFIGNDGGAIFNRGTIGNIIGNFIGNYVSGSSSASGGAIYNGSLLNTISAITGDFIGNYAESTDYNAYGGAIYNGSLLGAISDITGDFIGNYTESTNGNARGGAIYNNSSDTISTITGNFIGNYAESTNGNARGGAIYNGGGYISNYGHYSTIGNITGDFIGNHVSGSGGVIYNAGIIGDIAGNFINNYVTSDSGVVAGSVIVNGGGNLIGDSTGSEYSSYYGRPLYTSIGSVTGDFIGNYIKSTGGSAVGGAIYNVTDNDYVSAINKVSGNFTGNHIEVVDGYAYGGAIYNFGTIGDITGDFIGNYAQSKSGQTFGGAIMSGGTIGNITGDFIGNYAQSTNGAGGGGAIFNQLGNFNITGNILNNYAQSENAQAFGGAILSTIGVDEMGTMEISTPSVSSKGQDIFLSGNYTEDTRGKIYNALHVMILPEEYKQDYNIPADAVDFAFDTTGGGSITINDNIDGSLTDMSNVFSITDDRSVQYNLAFRGDDTLNDDGRTTQYIAVNNDIINAGKVTVEGTTLHFGSYQHEDEKAVNWKGQGAFVPGEGTDAVTSLSLTNAAFDLYNGYMETVNLKGWSASNSYLHIDVDPDPANPTADVLNIAGDVVGQTKVIVYAHSDNDIRGKSIVFAQSVNDTTGNEDSFTVYRVYNSPYMYEVGMTGDGTTEHEWYLTMDAEKENQYAGVLPDPIKEPAVPDPDYPDIDIPDIDIPDINIPPAPVYGEVVAYGALPAAALEQTRNMVDNVGGQVAATRTQDAAANYNLWVNPTYYTSNIDSPFAINADIWGIEAGGDIQRDINNRLGLFFSYRQGEYDMSGNGDKYRSPVGSEIDIDSYIAGLYYRYDKNNWYAFATLYGGIQEADIKTDDGMKSDTDGMEFGASAEVGYDYALTDSVTLTPELGVFYTQVNYDDATDNMGKRASYDDARQIELEAGVKLAKTFMLDEGFASVYVKPSVVQTIVDGDEVNITGLGDVEALDDATLGRIEIGGRYGFTTNLSAYGWANYTFGSDYDATTFGLGLNYAF